MKSTFASFLSGMAMCLITSAPALAQVFGDTPLIVFNANNGTHGAELWVSDGTTAGTRILEDIRPGPGSSDPRHFAVTEDGRAFFSAHDGVHGRELWVTNGTRGGTYMVADIRTGAEGSNPVGVTYIGRGRVVFSAIGNNGGREPWISDGTAAGTFRLVNANPGSADSYPEYFTRVNDRKFMFSAERNGQTRIWISDGSTGGTEIIPGPVREARYFTILDRERVLFSGEHPVRGREPWVYDISTGDRPQLLRDIYSGDSSDPYEYTQLGNGTIVFTARHPNHGVEPYITDGTRAGTSMLRALAPGGADSNPRNYTPVTRSADQLVFSTHPYGPENVPFGLWITDGTSGGTVRLHNHLSLDEPSGIARLADKRVVFSAQNRRNANAISRGRTLWATDGTSEGTTEIFRPNGQHFNQVNEIKPIGAGFAVFRALNRNTGWELYLTDGTAQGTSLLKDTNPSGDGWPMLFAVIQRMHDHD
ncbi:MAG: ELWxxDGT repeat protein [Roseinatronobacter sp.]